MPGKNILVIGGAGYIGSVLSSEILARGHRLIILDNLLYDNWFSIADLAEHPACRFIRGDLRHHKVLRDALKNATDVVLLAALVGDPICKKYPDLAREINETGAIRLMETVNEFNAGKFIFLSTCSNYGLRESDDFATEESELKPQSLYAETKVKVENYISENEADMNFCPVILRCATAFGLSRRMRFDLTVSHFTLELASGQELTVYDENTWRPYCHVRDISRAILQAIEMPTYKVRGRVYNVGSDEENYTKRMLVNLIMREIPRAGVRYEEGGIDPRNYRVSFNRIKSEFGFTAAHTVPDSIAKLIGLLKAGFFGDVGGRQEQYGNYRVEIRE